MNTTYDYDSDDKPAPDVIPAFEVPAELKAQIDAIKRQTSGETKPKDKPKTIEEKPKTDPQAEAEAERIRLSEEIMVVKKEREELEAAKAELKARELQELEDEARLNIKPKTYIEFESREKEPSMFEVANIRPTRNFATGRLEFQVEECDVDRFLKNHFVASGRIVRKA